MTAISRYFDSRRLLTFSFLPIRGKSRLSICKVNHTWQCWRRTVVINLTLCEGLSGDGLGVELCSLMDFEKKTLSVREWWKGNDGLYEIRCTELDCAVCLFGSVGSISSGKILEGFECCLKIVLLKFCKVICGLVVKIEKCAQMDSIWWRELKLISEERWRSSKLWRVG